MHDRHFLIWAVSILAALALGGAGLVDENFDANNPWFFVGLTVVLVTTVATNAVLREVRTRTLNDEFEAGYRVGYRAGRRHTLTVARPELGDDPIPLRPSRRGAKDPQGQNAWLDSDDSLQGSTRRP